jgi:hypothetical protein
MITLKNLKHFAAGSQETYCFTATVYLDGKKVGTAENDGHGGETIVRLDLAHRDTSIKTSVVDDLVHAAIIAKEDAKIEKKYAKKGADIKAKGGQFYTLDLGGGRIVEAWASIANLDAHIAKVKAQYGNGTIRYW